MTTHKRHVKVLILTATVIIIQACATSMTPSQFIQALPSATSAEYMKRTSNNCQVLKENRKYVAPIGFTVKDDVDNGAKGVDEWVVADGGNAYTINNFEWITVDASGATQLTIYFDTLLCEI